MKTYSCSLLENSFFFLGDEEEHTVLQIYKIIQHCYIFHMWNLKKNNFKDGRI